MNRRLVCTLCLLMISIAPTVWSHDKIQDQVSQNKAVEPSMEPPANDPADVESPSDLLNPTPITPKIPTVGAESREALRPQTPATVEPQDLAKPFVREPFVPAAPSLIPDVFTRYPGVPTWHATPVDLSQLQNHYSRDFYKMGP